MSDPRSDHTLLSPPRIHPIPHLTPAPSPLPTRSIDLPAPVDDGWVYRPPPNLPLSAVDAMGLATASQLHTVDMTDTFKMMTRGQTFTSYVTVMDKTGATRIEKRDIFIFFNKYEIDKDGKTSPASPESGALYWTSAECPSHQLTYHRSIPLRDIRELLLGKDSQCFQSPVGLHAVDANCFTVRCDSRQLDLECADEVQVTSWILGLVNLMLTGQSRSLKILEEDTPPPPSTPLHHPTPLPPPPSQRRQTQKRFSVCHVGREAVSADYRRASAAWMKAVNGDLDTPKAAMRRGTLPRLKAAPPPPTVAGLSKADVEAKVAAPFHLLQSSFSSLRREMTDFVHSLSGEVVTSLTRLSLFASAQSQSHARLCSSLQSELSAEQKKRKFLQNKVIDLQGNIRVYCRVRPTSEKEREEGDDSVIDCLSDSSLIIHTPTAGPPLPGSASAPPTGKVFDFDRVFDAASSQEEVYRDVAPFVQSCVDGFNVCVFAYGQTGSGKSHTMEGPPHDRGVNFRALNDLFTLTKVEEHRTSPYSPYYTSPASPPSTLPPPPNATFYSISVSCLEIYNESVVDLLVKKRDQRGLDIKQGPDGGVFVADLSEVQVSSVDEVTHLLQSVAYPNRHTSATSMNDHSSRSHCALFIRVVGVNPLTEEKTFGKLVLIDLAGSERLNRSAVTGVAVKEAQSINQSLSALGNCINALQTKAPHVPYRNSKLTYLLSDCLGGNSKCLMCCQLSPSASSYGESVCSLGFASRARSVELGAAKRNVGGEEVKKLKAAMKEERKERERWEKDAAKVRQSLKEREEVGKDREDAVARLTRELKDKEREMAGMREREAEREREVERLREACKKKERKRVEWPDTKRLQSPSDREQENFPQVANIEAPPITAVQSPLRESTAANKKRKESPTREDGPTVQKRGKATTGEAATVEPQLPLNPLHPFTASNATQSPAPPTAATPAFAASAASAPQSHSHSRIGAALREKYAKKTAAASSPSPPPPNSSTASAAVPSKLFSASSMRSLDVCVTPQSLCGSAASAVRFTSSSVAESASSRRGGMGMEGSRTGEHRRVRTLKGGSGVDRAPATPITSHYSSRRGDWRA